MLLYIPRRSQWCVFVLFMSGQIQFVRKNKTSLKYEPNRVVLKAYEFEIYLNWLLAE